jgi:AraC family transcriptional regulator, regulatory protein of adaptative response / methylated-DNA-[protein]-cysteine methyltransferase
MSDIASMENIRFGWGKSSLGDFVSAWGDDGLIAFEFTNHKEQALRKLDEAFPEALLIEDSTGLTEANAKLARLIDHPTEPLDIELDMRGSDFQKQVWELLRQIPAGTTVRYGEVAARMGMRDVREVASAIAANRIAILVPCHRVIKKDGSISGYRWGVSRKRSLLEREQRAGEFKLAC